MRRGHGEPGPTEACCPVPRRRRCPQAFAGLTEAVRADPYLHPHFRYYMREVRAVAYAQVGGRVGGCGCG